MFSSTDLSFLRYVDIKGRIKGTRQNQELIRAIGQFPSDENINLLMKENTKVKSLIVYSTKFNLPQLKLSYRPIVIKENPHKIN